MDISTALAAMSIPVCHPPYSGGERTYATYQHVGQNGTIYAEGREAETGESYALDLYTPGKYATLVQGIKALMEQAGYIVTVDAEIYEQSTGLRHIAMTAVRVGALYG